MTKSNVIGASVLLLATYALSGCGAEVDGNLELGDEPIGTQSEAVGVDAPSYDPPLCTWGPIMCNNMHCCGAGKAMTGAHINEGTFQCRAVWGADEYDCRNVPLVDRVVEGVAVKSCPVGYYMKGLHAESMRATCCNYPSWNKATSYIVDGYGEPPTQVSVPYLHDPWPWAGVCKTGTMHACPGYRVMEGINIGPNQFLCGQ